MPEIIEAVADSADFGPAYDGEEYVTVTFRIPKDCGVVTGIWHLKPDRPGTFKWATTKYPEKAEAREHGLT